MCQLILDDLDALLDHHIELFNNAQPDPVSVDDEMVLVPDDDAEDPVSDDDSEVDLDKLLEEGIELLNSCNLDETNAWGMNFQQLGAFEEANGHCHLGADDGELGEWCDFLRLQRKNSKVGSLWKERKIKLDSIGFTWNLRYKILRNLGYEQLKAWLKENGDYPSKESNQTLWYWCKTQHIATKLDQFYYNRATQLALGFYTIYLPQSSEHSHQCTSSHTIRALIH